MATKQEIDQGIAINMGGNIPHGHCLAPIRQGLVERPRERQWVIGEVVAPTAQLAFPADGPDKHTPCMQFVEMVGIVDPADCDQLAAMARRARQQNPPPGQGRLEDFPDDPHAELGKGEAS